MPIYFDTVAPHCPISRDQPLGPMSPPRIRTSIPRVRDLPTAIAAVNILRSIITQIVSDRTTNNSRVIPAKPRQPGADRTIDKSKEARWSEKKDLRIKKRYRYYGKDDSGKADRSYWVETERLERVVWYDKAWKTYLVFTYGDKNDDGELVKPTTQTAEP